MNIVTLWQNLGDGWELSSTTEPSSTTLVPRMDKAPDNVIDPIFSSVSIDKTMKNVETDYVDFVGSYDPVNIVGEDRTMIYLGADNTLYYPSQAMTINAFRSYSKLKGIEAGNLPANVSSKIKN